MESLHYLLMKAHANLNRWILNEAAELGLSPGQPKVLEYLMEQGESNQKAIADYCEIEQVTVGSILTRMERDGLIVRSQREGNGRSRYVSLTPKGREMGERMEAVFCRADALAAARLSEEERTLLPGLLEKVYCAAVSPYIRINHSFHSLFSLSFHLCRLSI